MMNLRLEWTLLGALSAALAGSLVSPCPATAQDVPSPNTDAGAATDAGTDTDSSMNESRKGASDAERIIRIRRGIELDAEKLRGLRIELRSRLNWFEDLAKGMTEVAAKLNEKKEALERLGEDGDPDETKELKLRIKELQQDYDLFNRQTDLALTAEKRTKDQIEALSAKIETEKRSLAELTGDAPITRRTQAVEPALPALDEKTREAPTSPLLPPGIPRAAAPKSVKEGPSAATAAQLRAHKVVVEKEQELERARFEVENHVERRRALETQLEFEDGLAKTEQDEIENLENALEIWQKRFEAATNAGDDERAKRNARAIDGLGGLIEEAKRATEVRAEYRASLRERLDFVEEEGLRVNSVADEKREELEKARRSLVWLESPVHPQNISHWMIQRGPRILLVIAMIALLLVLLQVSARGIARVFIRRRRGARTVGTGRADTLAYSFRSVARVLIVLIGVLLVLQEGGLDIRTVLGGAAIFGVAIAFGAQDLMRDYFSGFLILLEDQYQLGDLVTIEGITGTVESVNMRVTVLRDLGGRVHFIPNGNIKSVTNQTYGWGRPVFEIPVRFGEDVDRVIGALLEVATGLMADPDWKPLVSGEPEMLGVDNFTDHGVIIKFMIKTLPDQVFAVRREMLRRISKRFNELGIQISVPHRIIMHEKTDRHT
ncbi:MAG: mechanosensitive ion channel [Myxococcales bacterium]|nr:mechanosensitive ion channel [Myxococcales bacterium]